MRASTLLLLAALALAAASAAAPPPLRRALTAFDGDDDHGDDDHGDAAAVGKRRRRPAWDADLPVRTNRPLIGVLSQPGDPAGKGDSYIAASYVKLIEAAGARAVPFFHDMPDEEVRKGGRGGKGKRGMEGETRVREPACGCGPEGGLLDRGFLL